jgi:hypothetical protein
VGPVPEPGGEVEVQITAGSYRKDGRDTQHVIIVPPWEGEPLRLVVPPELAELRGTLVRPAAGERESLGVTGEYGIRSAYPYDPSDAGIRGYAPDLGALIHRIRIERGEAR